MSAVIDTHGHGHGGHHDHHGGYGGVMRWITTTNHKDIGTLYLWFSFTMFMVGGVMAMAIRLELFSPGIISERIEGMLKNYDFVSADTLDYFAKRPPQAERDAQFALDYVKRHAKTPQQQSAVLRALEFKCDVLWSMLDALYYCYVTPGHIAPGAFVPEQ